MENFILYEEIGRGTNSVVYKGRRKGTINFLAILCVDKCKRASITNWVRLTHEIEYDNIVKFYEWYETSNHLWMVVELCTGGTLEKVLDLDHCLPEDIIREFGKDIASGLHHMHQLGVVFADLCPKKILLDGPGVLKFSNFGLARLEGENLAEVYEQATAQHLGSRNSGSDYDLTGDAEYQAPEILKGEPPSVESDLWSFGVLLYHMHAGSTPFQGKNLAEIVQSACHASYDSTDATRRKNLAGQEIPDAIMREKPSADFVDLISGLLQKKPSERLTWDEVIKHPFWRDGLSLENTKTTTDEDSMARLTISTTESQRRSQVFNSSGETGAQRVSTAPERVDALDSTFTLSSRPHTAVPCGPEQRNPTPLPEKSLGSTFTLEGKQLLKTTSKQPKTPAKTQQQNEASAAQPKRKKSDPLPPMTNKSETIALEDVKDLIYHSSDTEISVIQDNPQITRLEPIIFDSKLLPFRVLSSVDSVTPDELYQHLQDVLQALSQNPGSAKTKSNVVHYLAHLCTRSSAIANFTINSQLLHVLATLARQSTQPSPEVGFRAARTIGLASCCATELEYGSRVTEVFSALADTIRENFRNQRVKLALLPALGQLLFLVAEQEEGNLGGTTDEDKRGNWSVPSSAYMLFNRCLREGEDPVVQHIACKTIEGVISKVGSHRKKFVSSSQQQGQGGEVVGTLLWTIANRAPSEGLKQSAMSALCRLNYISGNGSVFQGVIDKIGLPGVLSTLSRSSVRCVQSLITMFVENLHSSTKGQASRLAAGKDLLPSLMKFLDSPSTVVRAKVFLAVLMLMRRTPDALLAACLNRLVMYIERDNRKTSVGLGSLGASDVYPGDQTLPPNSEYMQSALNLLVRHILNQCPPIMDACVSLLDETSGRKHPSTNQVKQLKACLPTCTVLMHTVTSQVFRPQLVTSDFISKLGCLLSHATKFLQQMSTTSGLMTALGEDVIQQFNEAVLSIVESLSQHPFIITQHEVATMQSLVPRLIVLLSVYNKDGKAVCLKLLDDILGTILHHRSLSAEGASGAEMKKSSASSSSRSDKKSTNEHGLYDLIINSLLPEYQPILLGNDPLPAHGARLLSTMLEYWPKLGTPIRECGLLPIVLQVFSEQVSCVLGTCAQRTVSLLVLLLSRRDSDTTSELYDNSLAEHVISHLVEVSCQYMEAQDLTEENNLSVATEVLTNLMLLLKEMLTLVTAEVKKALQAKDVSDSVKASATETAESMLVVNKPLTELQGICIQMLCDEQELADLALNNFSMLIQLYGGDHPDTMADENMECLAEALLRVQPKQQKILLKIIKRVVSLNEYHAEHVYGGGDAREGSLLSALRRLAGDAEKKADSIIAQLSHEILAVVQGQGSSN